MQTERTCEKSVSETYLHDAFIACTRRHNKTSHAVAPHIKVTLCVADNGRLARCARRCVDTGDIFQRLRKKSERIGITHIRFCCVRYVLNIRELLDLVVIDASLGQPLVVKRNIVHAVFNERFELFELDLLDLRSGHCFDIFLKKHSTYLL